MSSTPSPVFAISPDDTVAAISPGLAALCGRQLPFAAPLSTLPLPSPAGKESENDRRELANFFATAGLTQFAPQLLALGVLTLEDINKGFDLMHEGESIRAVVVF